MNRSTLLCALIVVASPALAQEEAAGPWSGKATLGYLATSGNTDNSTLNGGFEIGYAPGKWAHTFTARAINSAEDDVTTAEAYELGFKSERDRKSVV